VNYILLSMATFNVNAQPFELPKYATRQAKTANSAPRPQNLSRPVAPKAQTRPAPVAEQVYEPVKQKSDILPFVVSTALINVGNQVVTKEAARPTLKPFSMEEQFQTLAQETNLNRVLRNKWTMWLSSPAPTGEKDVATYMSELQEAAIFATIPQFCEVWNKAYLEGNPPYSKIVVFKKGIKPVWEDPDNCKGGRFVIRGSTLEETLALFLVITVRVMTARVQGDYNDLCGVILHAKSSDQLWIQLWNKDCSDHDQLHRFKRYLNKLTNRTVAYQAHPDPKNRNQKPKPEETPAIVETPTVSQEVVEDLVKAFLDTKL
jgi:translation initiation factor 4E